MIVKPNTQLQEHIFPINSLKLFAVMLKDYLLFVKLRLTLIVVFSAVTGFLLAAGSSQVNWTEVMWLAIGGFLVTGGSNGFNQILEKETDGLMTRTANRPLPTHRMSVSTAVVLASVMGISGVAVLWYFMNPLSGILGALALILYTVAYTPLKKKTPFAVFVGAVPGAIPPMLGWVAATGELGYIGWILFSIQFIWQFPHFWAIAWVLNDDYTKAGFVMLPSKGGRNKGSAFQILFYSIFLIPVSLVPAWLDITGNISALVIAFCGVMFVIQALKLYITCDDKAASQLMFGSFIYLPIVQIAMVLDKV